MTPTTPSPADEPDRSRSDKPSEHGQGHRSRKPVDGVPETVAQLAEAGLPLESGLRAAAAEAGDPELAAALSQLAAALQRGEALDSATQQVSSLADPIRYLLTAEVYRNQRKGEGSSVLSDVVLAQSSYRSLTRTVAATMLYPMVLLGLTFVVFIFFQFVVTRSIQELIQEFNFSLPVAVRILFWWGELGVWFLLSFVLVVLFLLAGARFLTPRVMWDRTVIAIPFFGSLMRWAATAQLARMAALLLHAESPLPQALKLSAQSMSNRFLAKSVEQVAEDTEQGVPLDAAVRSSSALPLTLAPWLTWGLQSGRVSEGWEAAAKVFEERVRIRTQLLRIIFPPLVFLCIAFIIVVCLSTISVPIYYFMSFLR